MRTLSRKLRVARRAPTRDYRNAPLGSSINTSGCAVDTKDNSFILPAAPLWMVLQHMSSSECSWNAGMRHHVDDSSYYLFTRGCQPISILSKRKAIERTLRIQPSLARRRNAKCEEHGNMCSNSYNTPRCAVHHIRGASCQSCLASSGANTSKSAFSSRWR